VIVRQKIRSRIWPRRRPRWPSTTRDERMLSSAAVAVFSVVFVPTGEWSVAAADRVRRGPSEQPY